MNNESDGAGLEAGKKKKIAAVILSIVILLSAVGGTLFFIKNQGLDGDDDDDNQAPDTTNNIFLDSDGDGVPDIIEYGLGTDANNSNDAIFGTLIYDPTGNNYKTATRSINQGDAFVVNDENETRAVQLSSSVFNLSTPTVLEGYFAIDDNFTISSYELDNLMVNITDTRNEFLNVTNVLAGCFYNHTFGFGDWDGQKVFFISLIKAPAIFTNLSISGVFINVSTLINCAVLNMDIPNEVLDLIDSFDIENQLGIQIFLGGAIYYQTTKTITGDVLDIFTPQDAITLAQSLPFDLTEEDLGYITGFLDHVNMHLLVLMQIGSSAAKFDIWFVVVPSEYNPTEYDGVVSLSIAEANMNNIATRSTRSTQAWLKIHIGSTYDTDSAPLYGQKSVTDLWGLLNNPTNREVTVSSYALIAKASDVIQAVGGAFSLDLSILEDLTRFRDPAFALLVDYNITEYFNQDFALKEYLALALIPDANQELGLFARVNCPGVVYNLGDYLDLGFDFPVIFCDSMDRDENHTIQTNLSSIRNDYSNEVNTRFISHVNVSGTVLGVSLKSVAKYTQFIDPTGISVLMTQSPIDVGVYDLSYPDAGKNYHLATVYPKMGVAPNYLFRPAYVQGYYLNFRYAGAFISGNEKGLIENSSGSSHFSDGIFVGAINNILSALGTNSILLDGVLIADRVVPTTQPNYFTFTDVNYSVVEDESCVVPFVYGHAQFHGTIAANVWVTAEIKGSDGTSFFAKCKMQKDGGLFDGLTFIPYLNGDNGRFLMANGTKYLPQDTYNANIEITGWTLDSLFMGGTHLGSHSYQFTTTKSYYYAPADPNAISGQSLPVQPGVMYRSLGYLGDSKDWYYINLTQGDLLRVQYYNIHDANVEVTLYDPDLVEIATTDWSWSTTIQKVAQKTGKYTILVEYDEPGIYCLEIASIQDDGNNDFAKAINITTTSDFNNYSQTIYIEDGVSLSDLNDYYYVWLDRGQYIYAQYTNLGGTGIFGDADVELFIYAPNQTLLDDTWGELRTYVDGFAQTTGKYYLRVYRDTQDGFYNLSYWIRNGTPNLDSQSSIEVFNNSIIDSWLVITPYATMEHWYKIYVSAGEEIRIDMTGDIEIWLFAESTQVDTTSGNLRTYVSHIATANRWYYLLARPDSDTDFTLSFAIQDTPKPTSVISSISPYWRTATITITASTSSGNINYIELWYRYSSDNVTWNAWANFGADSTSPYSWTFNFPSGQGYYEFYSRAMDIYSKYEDAPMNADTRCGYDSIAPDSSADSIIPYIQTSTTIQITATTSEATSGITNVVLYYRYSNNNISWNSWSVSGTDYSTPWSWAFSWPNSEGYYQFYCVATDRAGNVEPNPALNDSRCFYNNIPLPVTLDWSTAPSSDGTSLVLTWSQYPDSDFASYNIYYSTSPGANIYIGKFTTVSTVSCTINGLAVASLYYFKVRVNDTGGLFADSNEVYSRTFSTTDTPGDFTNARTITTAMLAWSEGIDWAGGDSQDYFKIYLNSGDQLTVEMSGYGSLGSVNLYLYDPSQVLIDSSENSGSVEMVSCVATTAGWYYIHVSNEAFSFGVDWYTIWVDVI